MKAAFKRLAAVGGSILVAGCYVLQPAPEKTTPQVGQAIAIDITDAGRLALGGSMGPEIDRIEGRLVQKTPDDYTIAVSDVEMFRGGNQVWHGEQVHVKSEYVSRLYERRFSAARSVALGAAGAGAILYIATRSLLGNSNATRGEEPPDSAHTQRRPPRVPAVHQP